MDIQVTLGVTPANSPLTPDNINQSEMSIITQPIRREYSPDSLSTDLRMKSVPALASSLSAPASMILVLATSSGVVRAADTPPATAPHTEDSLNTCTVSTRSPNLFVSLATESLFYGIHELHGQHGLHEQHGPHDFHGLLYDLIPSQTTKYTKVTVFETCFSQNAIIGFVQDACLNMNV